MNPEIIHDKYSKKRDGKSSLYQISCTACNNPIMVYQKDGKGNLIRCYLDRVKEYQVATTEESLVCDNCQQLIGKAYIYKPENRLAFAMVKGNYARKPYHS